MVTQQRAQVFEERIFPPKARFQYGGPGSQWLREDGRHWLHGRLSFGGHLE